MQNEKIDVAVITGAKPHDVINFQKLFHSFSGMNCYIQHIDDFAAAPEAVRDSYAAVVFFFMMREGPTDEGLPEYCGRPKTALERLGQTGQGMVVLHHALLAYPQWPVWDEVVGITHRKITSYRHDETLHIDVADPAHPITRGLSPWNMIDETYLMASAPGGSQVLLTTRHERNMHTVAWTRQFQASRVFCLQSGHDHQAWENPNFRTVLQRGIEWSSRR